MLKRRDFLEAGVVAGAGMLLFTPQSSAVDKSDVVNLAVLGAGMQGRLLMGALLTIPTVRVRAVCDIWPYRCNSAVGYAKTYGHEVTAYADYRELLEKEKGLQGVVVATPDFVHAEQTIACLQAGLHVYCETPMAPTLDAAKSMVRAMKSTGKLLQMGYQRRSNPRYWHVQEKLLKEAELVDEITAAGSQWNRPEPDELGWPKRFTIAQADLQKYGYADMHEFRNWRWFPKYTAGPFAGYAAHQVDVLNWFIGSPPKSVMAAGGCDYYKNRPRYDNVIALFDYPLGERLVRASCQMETTTSGTAGNHELVAGPDGSIRISENPKWTKVFREPYAPEWDDWTRKRYLAKVAAAGDQTEKKESAGQAEDSHEVRAQETGEVTQYEIPLVLNTPAFQPHLENFLEAIRGKAKLTCPADVALAADAAVLKAIEAVAARRTLEISPDDLHV